MHKMEITVYYNITNPYDSFKKFLDKIQKDYPKAKIRIIFQ